MRILVYPHNLEIGGSQINAIDLAAAVRDRGHDVKIFAVPGPLAELAARRRLPLIPAGPPRRPKPHPKAIRTLQRVVEEERVDLVHAYEDYPCLEAFFGTHLIHRVPMVTSAMWTVYPYLPRSVPLIVATREFHRQARRFRPGTVALVEPPVNTDEDHPRVDASTFLRHHNLDDGSANIVVVSRLSPYLKLEGILRAIDAVARLAEEGHHARLVIVGDGPATADVRRRAEAVNARLDRSAVVLTGPMVDPRPAYAAADIVVGMGGSILRGMAFGKPAIVVGERGFSQIVSPDTVDPFLREGFYGLGDPHDSAGLLARQLEALLADEHRRRQLGTFGRELVCARFSLTAAAATLEAIYRRVLAAKVSRFRLLSDGIDTARRVLSYKIAQRLQRPQRRWTSPSRNGWDSQEDEAHDPAR